MPTPWQRIEELFHEVLAREPADRQEFLRQACGDDVALCRAVESLVAQDNASSGFLEGWAAHDAAKVLDSAPNRSAAVTGDVEQPPVFPDTERFTLIRQFRAGGMGLVYEVLDLGRNVRVALKVLPRAEPRALLRFKEEFRALGSLIHPNLISLYELFHDGRLWYFTMELVEGIDFASYIGAPTPPIMRLDTVRASNTVEAGVESGVRPSGPDEWQPRLRGAFVQLVEGVSALHSLGILHCDVKPANVLVRHDGRLVVLDYGLVRRIGTDSRRNDPVAGTPAYMSPEQIEAKTLTPASDWYAVGTMLYEALAGQRPFVGTSEEVLRQKLTTAPIWPATLCQGVPADLEGLCMALLRSDPLQRPSGPDILMRLRRAAPLTAPWEAGAREQAPFVGRATHLDSLNAAFGNMRRSGAVRVDMPGPSGTGKSTLLTRFLDRVVRSDQAIVLSARCFEQESVPFNAIDSLMDTLTEHLSRLPPDELAELLPPNVALLARIFPILLRVPAVALTPSPVAAADATELRRKAFDAFRELLARLGAGVPVIVAIDDLQWGDADSAALLAHLFQPPVPPRLLLLLSYRSEYRETSVCIRLLESHRPLNPAMSIAIPVGPLSLGESRELAQLLLQQVAAHASSQRDRIATEAEGNPYFINELVRHAANSTDWFVRGSNPQLDEVLWRRVQQLPEEPRRLLEIIAVAGQPLRAGTAYDAAGLQDIHSPVVLRAARLIRSSGPGLADDVEVYHDRIRESVTDRLGREVIVRHHACLAIALERSSHPDAETVASHFDRAEQPGPAGRLYSRAAKTAAEALAFARAARLYRLALERACNGSDDQYALQVQLAHALANAGRGSDSAAAYMVASVRATEDERLELWRLAATQYCLSGKIAEGRKLFRLVLLRLGLRSPSGPLRTRAILLLRRLQLRRTKLSFTVVPLSEVPPLQLRRLDALWSYSAALATVDVLGVAAVQTQGLVLALRVGEPYRVARSLAWEAVLTSASGWDGAERAAQLLAEAAALAERVHEPHADGMVRLAAGWTAFLQMRLRDALRHCRAAEEIFSDRCTAAWWELSTTRTMIAWSLVHSGQLRELALVTPAYISDARERGDGATLTNLGAVATPFLRLAADDTDGARVEIDHAAALWPHEGVHIQHVALMFSRLSLALYLEDGTAAWREITETWRSLWHSVQMHNQVARVVMCDLRARSAIAAGVSGGMPSLLGIAESEGRRIERESAPWAAPFAARIFAGLAIARGQPASAIPHLRTAVTGFDALQHTLQAAACRRRLGQIVGGDEGALLIAEAETTMKSEQVSNISRMTAMYILRCQDG